MCRVWIIISLAWSANLESSSGSSFFSSPYKPWHDDSDLRKHFNKHWLVMHPEGQDRQSPPEPVSSKNPIPVQPKPSKLPNITGTSWTLFIVWITISFAQTRSYNFGRLTSFWAGVFVHCLFRTWSCDLHWPHIARPSQSLVTGTLLILCVHTTCSILILHVVSAAWRH